MSKLDVPAPAADPIPESDWLPMIPFDVSEWGDNDPRYDPPFSDVQLRALVRGSRKRHGLPPLTRAEMDALVADAARVR
jgi:hypothetical protein